MITPALDTGVPSNGAPEALNGVPQNRQNGVPQNNALLIRSRNVKEDVREEVPETVVDAMLGVMGECDDESVRRVVGAARAGRPEIPDQVIVQIIHMKGPRIRANRTLDYPLRILERAVAETAQGVTGANLCRAHERALESRLNADTASDEWRREQEAVLNDPSVSEIEKDLIRRSLG